MNSLQRTIPRHQAICHTCARTLTTSSRTQAPSSPFSSSLLTLDPRSAPPPSRSQSSVHSSMKEALRSSTRLLPFRAAPKPTSAGAALAEASGAIETAIEAKDMSRMQGREWRAGDVYSPYDLGVREGKKWNKMRTTPSRDVLEMVGADPLRMYKNLPMMSQFVTETGRIKHNLQTGLKATMQRKMAKAVRRAIGCGLMPSVHRHPEVIARALGIDKYRNKSFRN